MKTNDSFYFMLIIMAVTALSLSMGSAKIPPPSICQNAWVGYFPYQKCEPIEPWDMSVEESEELNK